MSKIKLLTKGIGMAVKGFGKALKAGKKPFPPKLPKPTILKRQLKNKGIGGPELFAAGAILGLKKPMASKKLGQMAGKNVKKKKRLNRMKTR